MRVFREEYGNGFVDLLLGFRTDRAIEALVNGGMPDRLLALRVVQVYSNDALTIDIGLVQPA